MTNQPIYNPLRIPLNQMQAQSISTDSPSQIPPIPTILVNPNAIPDTSDPSNLFSSTQTQVSSIRIKNRRKIYLERNPQYFSSRDLELTDPLLYDRCVRSFQSAAEREADGKSKGWGGVLEADLWRGEARIENLRRGATKAKSGDSSLPGEGEHSGDRDSGNGLQDEDNAQGEDADPPTTKEEGLNRWKYEMTMRFLHGLDEDFDYRDVDENEEYDDIQIREEQERWFEDEEPDWTTSDAKSSPVIAGETGIQDF